MNDYDLFVIVDSKLDTNYDYDIKLVVNRELNKIALFSKLEELSFEQDVYFSSYTKLLYYTNVSCLVDLKKWLLNLADIFTEFNITSNLDSLNKVKK